MAVSNNNHFTINASYAQVPGTRDELPLIVLQYSNLENCRDQLCLIPSLGSSLLIFIKHLPTPNMLLNSPREINCTHIQGGKKNKIQAATERTKSIIFKSSQPTNHPPYFLISRSAASPPPTCLNKQVGCCRCQDRLPFPAQHRAALALVLLLLTGGQGFNHTSQSSCWSQSLLSRVGKIKASYVKAYPKPI